MTATSKRDPWQREPGAHEIECGGKKYRNLVLFTRECAACKARFGIYVSQRVADGHASNNNFGLKNCELHRTTGIDKNEMNALRTANATMKEELAGLYTRNRDLFEELQRYKALAAQYDLGLALVEHTSPSGLPSKLPWE